MTNMNAVNGAGDDAFQPRSEPLLNDLFNSITELVALIDANGTILAISDTAARQLGSKPQDLIGLTVFNLMTSLIEIVLVKPAEVERVIRTGKPFFLEMEVLGDPVYDTLEPIFDENKVVSRIALMKKSARHVTQQKDGVFAIQDSFKTLADNSPDVISRYDRDLRHIYISPSVTKATGLSPAVFIGKSNRELGLPEPNVSYWEETLYEVFETGEVSVIEYDIMTPIGQRHYEARRAPEFDEDGNVVSVLSFSRDITDYRKTEVALQNSQSRYRRIVDTLDFGSF